MPSEINDAALDYLLARAGLSGESRTGKLLYLILTSRLLDRPVSAAIKGPSAGGKSFLVEPVSSFFPPSALYDAASTILQQRLSHDPDLELRIAAEEQRKITRLRLEKLLAP